MKKFFSLFILTLMVMNSYAQGEYIVIQTNDNNMLAIKNTDLKQITVTDAPYPEPCYNYIWMPGNGNGWDHSVCPILCSENHDGVYVGYAYMDGDFKFTMMPEWDEERNNGSFASVSDCIDLGDKSGGNISYTGEPSVCYVVVNDNDKTLSVTPCIWGVVGNFNGWSVAAGEIVPMNYNKDAHCLEAAVTFDTDVEWKFARDNSWDVNFGGVFDALQQNGPNFATGAGSYTIQLFVERVYDGYKAVVK